MAQYYLVEEQNLALLPWTKDAERLGFLDFLRALQNDPPALPLNGAVCVYGIEDVLLASRPKMNEMAQELRRKLQHSASELNKLNANIAIVITTRIVPGAQLTVYHPTAQIPLYLIFGSPAGGQTFYPASFNLSSGL